MAYRPSPSEDSFDPKHDFRPPHRKAEVPDAGLPTFGYTPAQGKKSQIHNPETNRIYSSMGVSAGSPDFFKSTMKHAPECLRAYICDPQSSKDTLARRADPKKGKERAAGLCSLDMEKLAAHLPNPHASLESQHVPDPSKPSQWNKSTKPESKYEVICRENIKNATFVMSREHEPDRIEIQALCSAQSPQWFKCPIEDNKEFFEANARAKGQRTDKYLFEPTAASKKQAAHEARRKQMTGHYSQNLYCSVGTPDWMKNCFEENKEHFQDVGLKMHRRPSESSDRYREYPIEKCINLDPSHGHKETTHPLVVSKLGPRWMKSPYLSNKEHFEAVTGQPLKECEYNQLGFREKPGAKTQRRNMVSHGCIPTWMTPSVSLPPEQAPHPDKFHAHEHFRHPDVDEQFRQMNLGGSLEKRELQELHGKANISGHPGAKLDRDPRKDRDPRTDTFHQPRPSQQSNQMKRSQSSKVDDRRRSGGDGRGSPGGGRTPPPRSSRGSPGGGQTPPPRNSRGSPGGGRTPPPRSAREQRRSHGGCGGGGRTPPPRSARDKR